MHVFWLCVPNDICLKYFKSFTVKYDWCNDNNLLFYDNSHFRSQTKNTVTT